MSDTLDKLVFVAFLLVGLGGVAWVLWRWWLGSEDRPALVTRWIITAIVLAVLGYFIGPMVARMDYAGAFIGIPLTAVAGLIIAVLWVPDLAAQVGKRFGRLYDGGNLEAKPEPLFSIVEARRKQGLYQEAAEVMRGQLEKFPTHFRAQMVLAEILADDLNDLDGAAVTIERIINQDGHAPRNLCFALTRLADWRLKMAHDVDSARECFQRIIDRFPDTEESHLAQQRLARLSEAEAMVDSTPRRIEAPRADPHLGTRLAKSRDLRQVADPRKEAERLVHQLEAYPHDNRAREDLAILYADEFERPDLAAEQLEQLVDQPHAPRRHVVRWLNLLADYALRSPSGMNDARRALERVVERFPESGGAAGATRRLRTLSYEARKARTSQAVKFDSSSKG